MYSLCAVVALYVGHNSIAAKQPPNVFVINNNQHHRRAPVQPHGGLLDQYVFRDGVSV